MARWGSRVGGSTLIAIVALSLVAAPASGRTATQVRFLRNATSAFDHHLRQSTAGSRSWMRAHYAEMRGYPPYFSWHGLAWAPPTQFYRDLYAIHPADSDSSKSADTDEGLDAEEVAAHPSWVLRDGAGRPLYINHACNLSTHRCPAYAADVGNPELRSRWIAQAKRESTYGSARYAGIFVDNVNLEPTTTDAYSDGSGRARAVRPRDPRTGATMTDANWRRYVADFATEIRSAFPRPLTITHNTYWRQLRSYGQEQRDAQTLRALAATDRVELERGFNDGGIVGGNGPFGYVTYANYMDWLHATGKSLVWEPSTWAAGQRPWDGVLDTSTEARYELVNYFLLREGADALASSYQADPPQTGGTWWPKWDLDLGGAAGFRYWWAAQGVIRRDFAGGKVLLNPPASGNKCGAGPVARVTFAGLHRSLLSGRVGFRFDLASCGGEIIAPAL